MSKDLSSGSSRSNIIYSGNSQNPLHGSDPITAFDRVWQQGRYDGFSHGTKGQETTPFLDALVDQLGQYGNHRARPNVAEGGAGAGYHSATLAQNGFNEFHKV